MFPPSSSIQLLPELFTKIARLHPHAIAVEIPPGRSRTDRLSLSYAELDALSDHVARQLAPSLSRDRVVAILILREDPALFVAQLAVLKGGAAYACLDPTFPDERILEILNDAEAVALLTNASGMGRIQDKNQIGRAHV